MFDLSAVTVQSTQLPTKAAFFADVDVNTYPIMPEQRLWIACVLNSINEYEYKVKKACELFLQNEGKPISLKHKWRIEEFRHETQSRGFQAICEHADFPHSKVIKKLDEIDTKYGLEFITWI